MSFRAAYWMALAAVAVNAVFLFNYWAAFQPLSTLVYAGIVVALCGLGNVAVPFRFLGIRKRWIGAALFSGGVLLAFLALLWPAQTLRIEGRKSLLDDAMPEYQFHERHLIHVHASPQQTMKAVSESTFGDLKSFNTLMRIRAAALRIPYRVDANARDARVLDWLSGGFKYLATTPQEIVMGGIGRQRPPMPEAKSVEEFAAYQGDGVKIAFNFRVEDAGNGWSTVSTDTRIMALDDGARRTMGRYWRLIVPGSGLLRRQWLDGIKRRAETTART